MKKSLSVILSTAMALSVFSSVAFAAKADDFSDLKNLDAATKAKFDSMIQAGIFDGVEEGRFGLNDKMNRAQFAKVAALIFELKSSATTSSFEDVKSSDPANGYALPYIEALRVAGLTNGKAEGKYVPAGDVTKEELATFLIRGLGKENEALAKPGVSDQTVSTWAKGYVQLAQELKLFETPAGQPFNGTAPATRDLLVTSAYQAQQINNASKKLSVTEAAATGVKNVTVKFNREVDTTKATLALKRGNAALATDVKWADDKKSAVLTLKDVKVIDGTYTVTLSGVDASTVDKSTAEFKATDEKVTKIEFLNAGDTIAFGKKVGIKLKASNQYGENASFSAGNYTVFTSNVSNSLKKNEDGTLVLTLDVANATGVNPGIGVVPVNIFNNDSRVSADKTFKVGVAPYATKLELGEIVYSNSNKTLSSVGETATVNLYQYDQYGNLIAEEDTGNVSNVPNVIITPYEKALQVTEKKFDKVVFSLTEKASASGEYTATIYAGASQATAKLSVKSTKFAKKVEFGDFSGTLAAGDTDKYLPINVYDEAGNLLSADDIVDNADVIKVNSSVAGVSLQLSGEHKGQIKIASVPVGLANGYLNVGVSIVAPGVNSYVNKNIKISDARKAESLYVATDSKQKAIAGANTDLVLKVKDQNGEVVKTVTDSKYKVVVTTEGGSGFSLVNKDKETVQLNYANDGFELFNDGFTIRSATGASGTFKVTAKLYFGDKEVDSVSKEVVIAKADEKLTYNVASVSDLYAILDNTSNNPDKGSDQDIYASNMGRGVTIEAKDASGKTVAVPSNFVTGVSSSDATVVKAVYNDAGKAKLVGNKAGTASVVVTFKTASGETKDQTLSVKVKNDVVSVASLTAKSSKAYTTNVYTTMELKAKDNYGIEYSYDDSGVNEITKYDAFLGIRYSINGIVLKSSTGSDNNVTLNSNGTISIGSNVQEFTVKATAPNGTSVSTLVTN